MARQQVVLDSLRQDPRNTVTDIIVNLAGVRYDVVDAYLQVADEPADTRTLVAGNFQGYTDSPYKAWTGMWGHYRADDLQAESEMFIDAAAFPDNTTFGWDVTPSASWGGVNGYLHIGYGNYDDSVPNAITSRQVSSITELSVEIGWTFEGDEASGLLSECWLSPVAAPSGSFEKLHEVAFFPKVSTTAQAWLATLPAVGAGSFTDSNGVLWNVREEGIYRVAYRPGYAEFQGVLPFSDYFDFLIGAGEITGSEWFNGVAFGVEPHSGAGSLTVDTFDVTYS